jgi:hypothetical protein
VKPFDNLTISFVLGSGKKMEKIERFAQVLRGVPAIPSSQGQTTQDLRPRGMLDQFCAHSLA